MKYELTLEQRDAIMERLTEEQRHFIHHELVRGRRTLFARQLARKKCQFIPEDAEFKDIEALIEEWDYVGFTDSGEVSPHTKCECGRSLRYQHQVLHVPTNTMRYFGIEHLQLHTGIDAKAISSILKGFDVLDAEMNEVLSKYRDNWQLDQHLFLPLPAELEVPQDIQEQLDANLPLLDRQLARLRSRMRELDQISRQKRIAAAIALNEEPPFAAAALQQPKTDADTSHSSQGAFDFGQADSDQSAVVFDEQTEGQAAFLFDELADSQGTFLFDDVENSQGAFAFDTDYNQGAQGFGEAANNKEAAPVKDTDKRPSTEFIPTSSNPFFLSTAAQQVVDDALPFGRISARSISEFLIEQKLVRDDRMSTSKPTVYLGVAAYLDRLAAAGKCELVTATSEDRIYANAKVTN
ncbi:hypothetical protein FHS15_004031 [Paenibacillus castaneae]|uniref:DUF3895 domain-containing protein n=1 Tax=Paenibacillus castaneae TaxID=474957 RepID=UPI000C9CB563|nr:DUF3895 domain-containing protein [Paenibacillus castaneae]NIK78885.1 hypothetical protein [Paenibacillus castaneae]